MQVNLTPLGVRRMLGVPATEDARRIAVRYGYADQSHLTRDVQRREGESPRVLAAARRTTPATALGDLCCARMLPNDGQAPARVRLSADLGRGTQRRRAPAHQPSHGCTSNVRAKSS